MKHATPVRDHTGAPPGKAPCTRLIDVRSRPVGMAAHTYAYYRLKEVQQGEDVVLVLDEDPQVLMHQVQQQLRGRLAWDTHRDERGLWRVAVRRREDTEARALGDLLGREHERLDALFLHVLDRIRTGDAAGAAPIAHAFATQLRRHIEVENELLAPLFPLKRDPAGTDPTSTMLREHEQILEQLAIIEQLFDAGAPDLPEADTWLVLLSASLSKHEYREESLLFPQWDALLSRRGGGPELVARARRLLAGDTAAS